MPVAPMVVLIESSNNDRGPTWVLYFWCYMDKQLTLYTCSGDRHTVLTAEQLSKLNIPFPFVGTSDQYDAFLGTIAVLNPNNKMEHRYAGSSQDVPFGSLVWWIEYTQEY